VQGGRGSQPALIYDSPVTGTCRTFSYRKLLDEVARFGGVLRGLGVGAGDRVVIYTPMIPEALVAMLPCARVGAVHSVVFGGFAAHELAVRIDDAAPKVMVSASCGIEVSRTLEYKPILDRAIELAGHKPERCVIAQRAAASLCCRLGSTWTGSRRWPGPSQWPASRSRRQTRYTSCTPPAPPPSPKASSATTAATRSRCAGACSTSTKPGQARCSGPPRMWVGRRAFLHRLRPAARRVHDRAV
jgi:acyl-coenzyme A synthetase/AMP-(fatty) acid ligase